MMPWERETYATMLSNYIKEEEKKMEREKRDTDERRKSNCRPRGRTKRY